MVAHLGTNLMVLIEVLIVVSSLLNDNFRVVNNMEHIFTIIAASLAIIILLVVSIHIVLVVLTMMCCPSMA